MCSYVPRVPGAEGVTVLQDRNETTKLYEEGVYCDAGFPPKLELSLAGGTLWRQHIHAVDLRYLTWFCIS